MDQIYHALQEQFIQNHTATIPVRVESHSAFYSRHDHNGLLMAEEIAQYIDRAVCVLPDKMPVTLLFCTPALSVTKKDGVRNLVHIHYALRCKAQQRQLHTLLGAAGLTLGVGAALIGAGFLWRALSSVLISAGAALAALALAGLAWGGSVLLRRIALTRRLYRADVRFLAESAGPGSL